MEQRFETYNDIGAGAFCLAPCPSISQASAMMLSKALRLLLLLLRLTPPSFSPGQPIRQGVNTLTTSVQ